GTTACDVFSCLCSPNMQSTPVVHRFYPVASVALQDARCPRDVANRPRPKQCERKWLLALCYHSCFGRNFVNRKPKLDVGAESRQMLNKLSVIVSVPEKS